MDKRSDPLANTTTMYCHTLLGVGRAGQGPSVDVSVPLDHGLEEVALGADARQARAVRAAVAKEVLHLVEAELRVPLENYGLSRMDNVGPGVTFIRNAGYGLMRGANPNAASVYRPTEIANWNTDERAFEAYFRRFVLAQGTLPGRLGTEEFAARVLDQLPFPEQKFNQHVRIFAQNFGTSYNLKTAGNERLARPAWELAKYNRSRAITILLDEPKACPQDLRKVFDALGASKMTPDIGAAALVVDVAAYRYLVAQQARLNPDQAPDDGPMADLRSRIGARVDGADGNAPLALSVRNRAAVKALLSESPAAAPDLPTL